MKTKIIFLLFALSICELVNPDGFFDMPQLLSKYKYKYENHTIITEDGYKLVTFRILPAKKTIHNGQPVYLQHGVFCSSETFISGGKNFSIAYILADNGYDVWIPNSRGGMYSREHVNLTTSDPKFWNFTFEEQGLLDQRAVINYIIEVTGFPKVHFWSHSMGGTQMMVALILDSDFYRKHLLSAILTGPVFRFDTTKSSFIRLMNYTKIPYLFYDLGMMEFFPYHRFLSIPLLYFKALLAPVYTLIIKFITDERSDITDFWNIDVFFSHFPAGTSVKCFKHLVQLTEHTGFYRYREHIYDKVDQYDFRKIPDEVPIAVYVGEYDMLGSPDSMIWFQEQMLKYRKKNVLVKMYKDLGHAAFLAPTKNFKFLDDGLKYFGYAENKQ